MGHVWHIGVVVRVRILLRQRTLHECVWVLLLASFAQHFEAFGVLDCTLLGDRHAALAFHYSIMAVIDADTDEGRVKATTLPFEGFLEALCRMSLLKSLPTDEMIAQAEEPDAGAYLFALRDADAALAAVRACVLLLPCARWHARARGVGHIPVDEGLVHVIGREERDAEELRRRGYASKVRGGMDREGVFWRPWCVERVCRRIALQLSPPSFTNAWSMIQQVGVCK